MLTQDDYNIIYSQLPKIESEAILSADLRHAIEFLKKEGMAERELGRFEIPGTELFGFAQSYETQDDGENVRFEAHRSYIDVQFMVEGVETMKWLQLEDLEVTKEYEEEGDCLLGVSSNGKARELPFKAGEVMVLYPSDAHAPGIDYSGKQSVKKLVVKIPV